jgi:hypothetical protein
MCTMHVFILILNLFIVGTFVGVHYISLRGPRVSCVAQSLHCYISVHSTQTNTIKALFVCVGLLGRNNSRPNCFSNLYKL